MCPNPAKELGKAIQDRVKDNADSPLTGGVEMTLNGVCAYVHPDDVVRALGAG